MLDEPQLKLKRAMETRWLSHESVLDALQRCLKAVRATLEQETEDGDATAHGLALKLSTPNFIAVLLLLSDVSQHAWQLILLLSTGYSKSFVSRAAGQECIDSSI